MKSITPSFLTLYAVTNELDGLVKGDVVLLDSIEVGQIGEISFFKNARLLIEIQIDSACTIGTDATGEISSDVIFNKYFVITSRDTDNLISNLDTIPVIKQQSTSIRISPSFNFDSIYNDTNTSDFLHDIYRSMEILNQETDSVNRMDSIKSNE